MALTNKKIAHGTVLKIGTTAVGNIRSIQPPETERNEVDAITLDSAIDDTLPGDPIRVGRVRFVQFYEPGETNAALLDAAMTAADVTQAWTIEWPQLTAPKKADFTGYVVRLGPEQLESESVIAREVVIKLTSTVAITNLGGG